MIVHFHFVTSRDSAADDPYILIFKFKTIVFRVRDRTLVRHVHAFHWGRWIGVLRGARDHCWY